MAVDDFIIVVPPGWFDIQGATAMIEAWAENSIQLAMQERNFAEVTNMLEAAGILPEGMDVVDAQLLANPDPNSVERLRLWVKYG